jgi:hypothetical protein
MPAIASLQPISSDAFSGRSTDVTYTEEEEEEESYIH